MIEASARLPLPTATSRWNSTSLESRSSTDGSGPSSSSSLRSAAMSSSAIRSAARAAAAGSRIRRTSKNSSTDAS